MKITAKPQFHNERIDKYLEIKLKELGFKQATRNMIKDNVSEGVRVNGRTIKASYRLNQEDEIEIDKQYWEKFFEKKDLSEEIIAQEGKLNIIFEDEHLIVLQKPKGLVVHPGAGNRTNTLANYVKGYLQNKDEFDKNVDRAGIVHRLDKAVSGIMVIAKNKKVQNELKTQFSKREVQKIYLARVRKYKASELSSVTKRRVKDVMEEIKEGNVDYKKWFEAKGYIGRGDVDRYKMEYKLYEFSGSKPAKSYILPLKGNQMLIKIVTGRMHQIRATLYYYGYYIKGDTLYKPKSRNRSSDEIALQSVYLSFKHPITKENLSFITQNI
jgi:23S rRNA pseudouridine1911/1915/1917 synthase